MMAEEQAKMKPNPGLLWRMPTPLGLFVLLACLAGPFAIVMILEPEWGLLGAVVAPLYVKIRYPGVSFGPTWLTILDMLIVFGNAGLAVLGLTTLILGFLN